MVPAGRAPEWKARPAHPRTLLWATFIQSFCRPSQPHPSQITAHGSMSRLGEQPSMDARTAQNMQKPERAGDTHDICT